MKKTLIILSVFSFAFSGASLYVCGHTDDGAGNATFDICMNSDEAVAGVQFSFESGTSGFAISGTSGGAMQDAGFTASTGSSLVLGFSFTGATIAPMDGVLTTISGTYANNGLHTVGPYIGAADAFSNASAGQVVVEDWSTNSALATQWEAGNDSALLDAEMPAEYSLKAAYPNPFNPSTTIEYNVEVAGNVNIAVYDMMGREVKTLVNEYVSPKAGGTYSVVWDGTNNSNAFVSTGVYIYRMVSNEFTKTQKMTLTK